MVKTVQLKKYLRKKQISVCPVSNVFCNGHTQLETTGECVTMALEIWDVVLRLKLLFLSQKPSSDVKLFLKTTRTVHVL